MGREAREPTFERELWDLLLTAFADGEQVEGEWAVTSEPDQIPDWRVTVRRDETGLDEERVVGDS